MRKVFLMVAIALLFVPRPSSAQDIATQIIQSLRRNAPRHPIVQSLNSPDPSIREYAIHTIAEQLSTWCFVASSPVALYTTLSWAQNDELAIATAPEAFRYLCPEKRNDYEQSVSLLEQVEGRSRYRF
ncbi:MAG: hypothetical protein SNJ57_10235 [Cyanobacteriota bacterium]